MRASASACDAAQVALRCLIVDDNRPFLDAARALLERQGLDSSASLRPPPRQ
jgi:hypothetical protein